MEESFLSHSLYGIEPVNREDVQVAGVRLGFEKGDVITA